jgi:hypothetical protein
VGLVAGAAACSGEGKSTSDSTDVTDVTDTDVDTDTDTDVDTDTDTDTDTHSTPFEVPTPVGDPATIALAGECPLETRYGGFNVDVYEEYSLVSGSVADGVNPVTILEEMAAESGCRLLRRNNPFCDPPCDAGDVCDFDGTCIPFPSNQDLGTVSVGGLAEDVVMRPIEPGRQYFDTTVPHPVFEPGDLVELRSWDTTFGSDVTLHGVGVEPITTAGLDTWVIFDNQPLHVTWNAPGDSLQSRVWVKLNIDQHGTTPVTMYCDLPDSGSADLPASLLHTLINFGVTGFPNATIARRTVDSTAIGGGCMELSVTSPTQPSVRVDGFIPCAGTPDCPSPQICDPVTFICRNP